MQELERTVRRPPDYKRHCNDERPVDDAAEVAIEAAGKENPFPGAAVQHLLVAAMVTMVPPQTSSLSTGVSESDAIHGGAFTVIWLLLTSATLRHAYRPGPPNAARSRRAFRGYEMSNILYEANPSMVRMHPLGTVLVSLSIVFGVLLAVAGKPLLATLGIPIGDGRISGIIGIALVVIGFVVLVSWWISTKVDRLVIKENEIVWTHGLIDKQYTEIHMSSVRTVRVSQGILQRIMDAGDVTIFTSGDAPELVVKGLPNPGAIRDHIKAET